MTLDNKGLSKEEWVRVVDVGAFSNVGLLNLFRFSSESGFVSLHISAVEEDAISRNAHTGFNLNNVSND